MENVAICQCAIDEASERAQPEIFNLILELFLQFRRFKYRLLDLIEQTLIFLLNQNALTLILFEIQVYFII